ncbi:cysteine desulfurase family protein [uncultured Eubacterium sp.]|uniref:cysteine desulfurase family protein n=1 Tax=uncultured Eubacterium sp. TaxID=165185 RepID=UPI0025EDF46C|nr:cysteine desulfurase family protein [uncultured Eubacterium sp.]
MKRLVYLDNAATTQPFPEVLDAMIPYYSRYYGNPSSGYELGEESKRAMDLSRKCIADTLQVAPETIYFTSGGTESDNWALRFAVGSSGKMAPHIITTAIEHHAILNTCKNLEKSGVRVTYLPVNKDGLVSPEHVKRAICQDTVLISVMYANNEIGSIQPISKIAEIAHQRKVLFHTDAVQAYGQIPIRVKEEGIDLLSASGHKFNGPKGTGFLYARKGLKLQPMIHGGGQERKMRAGTENVPGIVGIGKAAYCSAEILEKKMRYERKLQKYLIDRILTEIPESCLNGSLTKRLPNNINISIAGINGPAVVALLDLEGICASSASACSAGMQKASNVQLAIGKSERQAYEAIRFTLGVHNTREELDYTVDVLKQCVKKLRDSSGCRKN